MCRGGRCRGTLTRRCEGRFLACGRQYALGVELARHAGVAVVSAAVDEDRGRGEVRAKAEDEFVAPPDRGLRQAHLAEAIVDVDIGPADPEDEVGLGLFEHRGEGLLEGSEVVIALNPARQRYIAIAGLFLRGIVFSHVDGIGEDRGIATEVGVVRVALVGIRVDDENLILCPADRAEVFDRDGDVIEHTEAESVIRKSVMGAAGEVGGEAVFEGGHGCGHGSGGFEHGPFQEAWIGGEPKTIPIVF